MHEELSQRLADLGFFDWETGPLDHTGDMHYLSIQLGEYDDAGIRLREKFFSEAPDISKWELLASRPAKEWSRKLLWGKNRVEVSASDWKFSLYRYDDGKYDIVLNSLLPSGITNDEKQSLVVCVLVSEFGDVALKEKVNAIDVEEKPLSELDSVMSLNEVGDVLLSRFR